LFGKVFGDRGDVSQKLAVQLWQDWGIQLITKLKRRMKNRLMNLADKLLLRRRAIIESVIDPLKNISQIEHSRHRSPVNCFVNLVCGLIAYCHQPKKPSLIPDASLPAFLQPELTLNLWSEVVLVVWGLPEVETTCSESGRTRYTSPEAMLFQSGYANARQLSDYPRIRLVEAGKDLTSTETALLNAGHVEL
jgi:hypothetical protein